MWVFILVSSAVPCSHYNNVDEERSGGTSKLDEGEYYHQLIFLILDRMSYYC